MMLVNEAGSHRAMLQSSADSAADSGVGATIARILSGVSARYVEALALFARRLEGELPDSEIQRHLNVISELRDTWEKLHATVTPRISEQRKGPVLMSNFGKPAE